MTSDIQILSSTPGRQRWFVPALRSRRERCLAAERWVTQQLPRVRVTANPLTGRILLEWQGELPSFGDRQMLRQILEHAVTAPAVADTPRMDAPTAPLRTLVAKLWTGGFKLSLLVVNRAVFGTFTAGPLAVPIAVLSGAGAVITGFHFIRGLFRTLTGRAPVTTATLIGTATLSSIALRESVTALVVIWLLNLGEYLEALTLRSTRAAIRELLSADDGEIWLVRADGTEVSASPADARPGQIAAVRDGHRIPVDGIVVSGEATVNEAAITGESMPAERVPGDRVFAGSVVLAGHLQIRITHVGSETAVGRLIERVEMAHALRPEIQTVGDAFAKKVVPVSLLSAAAVLLLTGDTRRALTMLLVACPCAAGLATPTAVSASIGNSARRGILIKGGRHLESLSGVDTISFDKTGTLTESLPTVKRVVPLAKGYTEERVLQLAARAEARSQHPLALAIRQAANGTADVPATAKFETVAGRGVRASWGRQRVVAGSLALLRDLPGPAADESVVWIAHQGCLAGMVAISAPVRPGAAQSIRRLRRAGISRFVMLTGDGESVASHIAAQVGIDQWHARLLPEQKFEQIRSLRSEGRRVAMVGDGINDAPALAVADIGIAMGTAGSDVAIETADIALAADNLDHIGDVLAISRRTMSVVRQNYGLSLGVNSVGLAMAAAGRLNPIVAAVLHNLSTIMVIFNSTRLIRYAPPGSAAVMPPRLAVVRPKRQAASAGGCCCSGH